MLARLGAGTKAISGGPLNFSDLAAMMGPSLTDAGRLSADDLRTWLDLYGKAFEQVLKLRISLRTLHVADPHKFSLETSQTAETAREPIFSKMKTILLVMREEISNGRADADQFQALYNRLINIPHNEQT